MQLKVIYLGGATGDEGVILQSSSFRCNMKLMIQNATFSLTSNGGLCSVA